MKKRLTLILIFILTLVLTGCAKTNERDVFRFEAHQLEMRVDEKMELKLLLGNISESEKIIYTSSNPDVVSLNDNIATALSVGVSKITAYVERIPTTKATVEITVANEKLSGLQINGNSEVLVKQTVNLSITTYPSTISKDVVWSSSNNEIATVDNNGLVTTHKPGLVTISATSKYDSSLVAKKNINVLHLNSESLELDFNGSEIILGEPIKINATVLPELANQNNIWESSNTSYITVVDGLITPVKVTPDGETVKIKVTTADKKITKELELKVVYAPIEEIKIISTEVEVFEEKKIALNATVTPATANQEIVWSSGDESIATVSNTGVVTGVKKGTVKIIATGADGKKFDEIEITVVGTPDPTGIRVFDSKENEVKDILLIEREVGEELTISIEPSDAKQAINWEISKEGIVEIEQNSRGIIVINDIEEGEVTVTFYSTVAPEIKITITIKVVPLGSLD